MKKKILFNMCILSVISILLCSVLIVAVYYQNIETQIKLELKAEAEYIGTAADIAGNEYLKAIDSDKTDITRVTLITSDGSVVFDNTVGDVNELDNHLGRTEIQNALKYGSGSSTRFSDTLREKTFYYAVRLDDGSVLRVARTTDSIVSSILSMLPLICVIIAAVCILSVIIASILTKNIVKPILNIDLNSSNTDFKYDELSPLLARIEKQSEQIRLQIAELKKKQAEFNAITDNMNEGFIVIDSKADVLSYNHAALNLLGIRELQYHNKNILTFNRSSNFRDAVDIALSGKASVHELTVGERHYQIIANPVFDENNVKGAVFIIIDNTEKEAREKLRREFSANVSHELKTPLTSISGYAEIIKNGLVKNGDIPRFVEKIYDESQRLILLVNDIIKISNLDETNDGISSEKHGMSGRRNLKKEKIDLYSMAESVLQNIESAAAAKRVTLSLSGEHVTVTGIERIIEEILFNLCDNAVKYNKDSGFVNVTVGQNDKKPYITVKDTGIGISADDRERVFERFYRSDKSRSGLVSGTGLGLSIVKHGALLHNAVISLSSEENIGTEITVTFPAE